MPAAAARAILGTTVLCACSNDSRLCLSTSRASPALFPLPPSRRSPRHLKSSPPPRMSGSCCTLEADDTDLTDLTDRGVATRVDSKARGDSSPQSSSDEASGATAAESSVRGCESSVELPNIEEFTLDGASGDLPADAALASDAAAETERLAGAHGPPAALFLEKTGAPSAAVRDAREPELGLARCELPPAPACALASVLPCCLESLLSGAGTAPALAAPASSAATPAPASAASSSRGARAWPAAAANALLSPITAAPGATSGRSAPPP